MRLQLLFHLLYLLFIVIVVGVVIVFHHRSRKAVGNVFEDAGDAFVKCEYSGVVCVDGGGGVVGVVIVGGRSNCNDSYN